MAGSALPAGAAADNVRVGTAQNSIANTASAGGTITIYSGIYQATHVGADQNTSAFQAIITGANVTTTKAYSCH